MSSSPSPPLPVVPLNKKVLLPGVVLKLILCGQAATELVRKHFKSHGSQTGQPPLLIACVPLARQPPKKKGETPPSDTTTLVPHRLFPFLSQYGCSGRIVRVQRLASATYGVFVEGVSRFTVNLYDKDHATARVDYYDNALTPPPQHGHLKQQQQQDPVDEDRHAFEELVRRFVKKLEALQIPADLIVQMLKWIDTKPVPMLADMLVCLIDTTFEEKMQMLETATIADRIELAKAWMRRQLHLLQIQEQVNSHVEAKMSRQQREFYLRQQLEAIEHGLQKPNKQHQPGSDEDNDDRGENDLRDLRRRLVAAKLPTEALEVAQRELERSKRLDPTSPDWAVVRYYLELLADLPWENRPPKWLDIGSAKKQLDGDHYGLPHVKKRIIEYLSVAKLKGDLKAPILCFVGPPGVGKTSLGRSIAAALSRKFHRVSLGGVRDEADMRGHRRTYVGAMPGLIIQGIRRSGVNNPVFLLDEIDKLARSRSHGDPAAALLEVLDPEQNHTFNDHYLNVPFDLSSVVFIATANSLDTVPPPLLDRMEVIHLSAYTFEEKLHIAKTHLLPKQLEHHGLDPEKVQMADEILTWMMERYTRESGVRSLERTIASVIRAKCVELAGSDQQKQYDPRITQAHLYQILGHPLYDTSPLPDCTPGIANSLANEQGVLVVEAIKTPGGKGRLVLTGSLGKVLQESAQLALAWVRASSLSRHAIATHDLHIHFPGGSVPKDGPSAGLAIVLALMSLLLEKTMVDQETTAMTGEMTLRGRILPVKDIKSKVVSAHLVGIRIIVLPEQNRADVETHVPDTVRCQMQFVYVTTVQQAMDFLIPLPSSVERPEQQRPGQTSPWTRTPLESRM